MNLQNILFKKIKVPATAEEEQLKKEDYYLSSQWALMGRKFKKHTLAKISLVVLGFFVLSALFSEFVSPYLTDVYLKSYTNCPPSRIHWIDNEGKFHLRPFVYALKSERDPVTNRKNFVEDKEAPAPIYFFVKGAPYKFWGLFEAERHLYGTASEVPVFILGSDRLGRDLFTLIVYGTRISLSIGLIGVFLSIFLGVLIGGISGLVGGVADVIIQRVIEVIRSFPTIPLWMALSAAIPPNLPPLRVYFLITIILSFIGWTSIARRVRSKFISMREEDFVMAARVSGAGMMRIIFSHLVPGFLSYLIVELTLAVPNMILGETSLSFLGLGLRDPIVSWGVLLKDAQKIQNIALYPWLLWPLFSVVITVLAFNFIGDGLRDAADPYK